MNVSVRIENQELKSVGFVVQLLQWRLGEDIRQHKFEGKLAGELVVLLNDYNNLHSLFQLFEKKCKQFTNYKRTRMVVVTISMNQLAVLTRNFKENLFFSKLTLEAVITKKFISEISKNVQYGEEFE